MNGKRKQEMSYLFAVLTRFMSICAIKIDIVAKLNMLKPPPPLQSFDEDDILGEKSPKSCGKMPKMSILFTFSKLQ